FEYSFLFSNLKDKEYFFMNKYNKNQDTRKKELTGLFNSRLTTQRLVHLHKKIADGIERIIVVGYLIQSRETQLKNNDERISRKAIKKTCLERPQNKFT